MTPEDLTLIVSAVRELRDGMVTLAARVEDGVITQRDLRSELDEACLALDELEFALNPGEPVHDTEPPKPMPSAADILGVVDQITGGPRPVIDESGRSAHDVAWEFLCGGSAR